MIRLSNKIARALSTNRTYGFFYIANTLGIVGTIATLVMLKTAIFSSLLLLTSLLALILFLFSEPSSRCHVSVRKKFWIVALAMYVGAWIFSLWQSGEAIGPGIERPLKLLASGLIFVNLLVYGFHRLALLVGAIISTSLVFFELFFMADGSLQNRTGLGLNPNAFGYVMAGISLTLCSYSFVSSLRTLQLVTLFSAMLGITASLASGSRSLIVVYILYFLGVIYLKRKSLRLKHLAIGVLLASSLVSILQFSGTKIASFDRATEFDSTLLAYLRGETDDLSSGQDSVRASMYIIATATYLDNLIIGAGNNVKSIVSEYQKAHPEEKLNWSAVAAHSSFHNLYLDTASRMGSIGLVSLLLFFAMCLVATKNKIMMLGPLSVAAGGGMFDSPFAGGQFLIFFAISVAAILASSLTE
jgi:O-antigen ligase